MKYIIKISKRNHRTISTGHKTGSYRRSLGCSTQHQVDQRLAELVNFNTYLIEFDTDRDAQLHCNDLNLIFSEVTS